MRKRVTAGGWVLVCFCLLAGGAWAYIKAGMHGFSARAEPSKAETVLAEYARSVAMPASAKTMKNPVAASSATQHEALAHYADHCAVCHANNGSGETMFGRGMYPKPPNLRSTDTQGMSDGELFYTIENGIRMSGMPAFGGPGTEEESWKLVSLLRHLPQLTAAEEAEMETLNPKGPQEIEEEKAEEEFLNGQGKPPGNLTRHNTKGHIR